MSWQLKAYSALIDEDVEIGPKTDDFDQILGISEYMAEGRPGLIVHVEGSRLPKWEDT
jgi:hypothetical protein